MKRYKKFLIILVIVLAVIALSYCGFGFYLNQQINAKQNDLDRLYQSAQLLERDQKHFTLDNLSWWKIGDNWQLLHDIDGELQKLPQMQQEISKIEKDFADEYSKFTQFAQTYQTKSILTDYIAKLLTPVDQIDFKSKKQPQNYVQAKYNELRGKVREINSQAPGSIKWTYLPDLELKAMSNEEKVGQLFIWTVKGTTLTQSQFLSSFQPSGIILMGENIQNTAQVQKLTAAIQNTNPLYPLIISTDEEGGIVKRIPWDPAPGQKTMAQLSADDACKKYQMRDSLLTSLGINTNFGIVADITSDPKSFIYQRVFSGDANKASQVMQTAVKCSEKTLTTAKHFPGHGRTNLNTHLIVASYDIDLNEWKNTDGKVFQTAIDSAVDMIMMGHLNYSKVTGNEPASLSSAAVDYLRTQMKFSGLIITDDLGMLSSNKNRSAINDLKSAVKAGNDLLLYVIEPIDRGQAKQIVLDMVKNGELQQADLDARVKLILQYKLDIK